MHSNWGTESDPEFKGYHNGNSEPRGFGMYHFYQIIEYLNLYNFNIPDEFSKTLYFLPCSYS